MGIGRVRLKLGLRLRTGGVKFCEVDVDFVEEIGYLGCSWGWHFWRFIR